MASVRSCRRALSARWAAFSIVERWWGDRGLPVQLLWTPIHLRQWRGLYCAPSLWPTLVGLQHDEKDLFSQRGSKGLQDWGDDEAQRLTTQLEDALGILAARMALLQARSPHEMLDVQRLADSSSTLLSHIGQLRRYSEAAALLNGQRDKQRLRLERKKKRMTSVARCEGIERRIAEINGRCAEVVSFDDRTKALSAGVAALPAAPAAACTTTSMLALLGELKALLELGFALANAPASKMLAVCTKSVFDCSKHSVNSLYWTVDDAKTWQVREAVYRSIEDSCTKGLVPLFVGADKAYAAAAHCDLEGYPKTRSAAKREVEYLTSIMRMKSGRQDVSIKNWRRTIDLREATKELLSDPRARAAGIVHEPWMDDFYKSQTRERWRDFLLAAGMVNIEVWLTGVDGLGVLRSSAPA